MMCACLNVPYRNKKAGNSIIWVFKMHGKLRPLSTHWTSVCNQMGSEMLRTCLCTPNASAKMIYTCSGTFVLVNQPKCTQKSPFFCSVCSHRSACRALHPMDTGANPKRTPHKRLHFFFKADCKFQSWSLSFSIWTHIPHICFNN